MGAIELNPVHVAWIIASALIFYVLPVWLLLAVGMRSLVWRTRRDSRSAATPVPTTSTATTVVIVALSSLVFAYILVILGWVVIAY